MIPLPGQSLSSLPISGLCKVRDLEYFDGPLLSHFQHARGGHYLSYWCDRDEEVNRWMLIRVGEASIVRLINRFIPLDRAIPQACQDDYVYFIDLDTHGATVRASLCITEQIPEGYLPKPGVYLEYEPSKDDRSYAVLIEGTLTNEQLSEIPVRYGQAYAFLYLVNVLRRGYPQSFPCAVVLAQCTFIDLFPTCCPRRIGQECKRCSIHPRGLYDFLCIGQQPTSWGIVSRPT